MVDNGIVPAGQLKTAPTVGIVGVGVTPFSPNQPAHAPRRSARARPTNATLHDRGCCIFSSTASARSCLPPVSWGDRALPPQRTVMEQGARSPSRTRTHAVAPPCAPPSPRTLIHSRFLASGEALFSYSDLQLESHLPSFSLPTGKMVFLHRWGTSLDLSRHRSLHLPPSNISPLSHEVDSPTLLILVQTLLGNFLPQASFAPWASLVLATVVQPDLVPLRLPVSGRTPRYCITRLPRHSLPDRSNITNPAQPAPARERRT